MSFVSRTHQTCVDCNKTFTRATMAKYDGERCGRCYGKMLKRIVIESTTEQDIVPMEIEDEDTITDGGNEFQEEQKEQKSQQEYKRSLVTSLTEVYEVEEILNGRIVISQPRSYVEYLVKWVGYQEPTWEHEDNCEGCQEAIGDFKNKAYGQK